MNIQGCILTTLFMNKTMCVCLYMCVPSFAYSVGKLQRPRYKKFYVCRERMITTHHHRTNNTVTDPAQMQLLLRFFQLVTQEHGRALVVHCFAGKGRTGTALAFLLRAVVGLDADEAVRVVREERPGSIETHEQAKFVGTCPLPSKTE